MSSDNKPKFIKIPNELIAKDVRGNSLKLYAALAFRCYGKKTTTWISNKTITEITGIKSRTTLSNCKKDIEAKRYLSIYHRKNTSNLYKVRKPREKYTIVEEKAFNLSPEAFKLYSYLKSLYRDDKGRRIKLKKVLSDTGISRRCYLEKWLDELSESEFLKCIMVDTKKEELHYGGHGSAFSWTSNCIMVDTNHTVLIILLESNTGQQIDFMNEKNTDSMDEIEYIEKNKKGFHEGAKAQKNQKPPISARPAASSRKVNKAQIRGNGKFCSPLQYRQALDAYDEMSIDSKKQVMRYVKQQMNLYPFRKYSSDPKKKRKDFIVEYMVGGYPIAEEWRNMTEQERKAELKASEEYKAKRIERQARRPGAEKKSLLEQWREG
jgi:hypothetical protein